jgi:hypothetical protein
MVYQRKLDFKFLTMKRISRKFGFGFSITAFVFTFLGCGKEEVTTPVEETGSIEFHMHSYLGGHEIQAYFALDSLDDGRKIRVDKARLFLSNIQLEKVDGSLVPLDGRIILTERGVETYDLGQAPIGNYVSVRFYIGLDETLNLQPSLTGDTVLETPSMWLGQSLAPDGRKFIHFKGKIDPSLSGNTDTTTWKPFDFQLGTGLHHQQVILPKKNFSILPAYPHFVHLEIDFAKLLEGLDIAGTELSVIGAAGNAGNLSNQLKSKTIEMVRYEE